MQRPPAGPVPLTVLPASPWLEWVRPRQALASLPFGQRYTKTYPVGGPYKNRWVGKFPEFFTAKS